MDTKVPTQMSVMENGSDHEINVTVPPRAHGMDTHRQSQVLPSLSN
jgi:hypothetical protein